MYYIFKSNKLSITYKISKSRSKPIKSIFQQIILLTLLHPPPTSLNQNQSLLSNPKSLNLHSSNTQYLQNRLFSSKLTFFKFFQKKDKIRKTIEFQGFIGKTKKIKIFLKNKSEITGYRFTMGKIANLIGLGKGGIGDKRGWWRLGKKEMWDRFYLGRNGIYAEEGLNGKEKGFWLKDDWFGWNGTVFVGKLHGFYEEIWCIWG